MKSIRVAARICPLDRCRRRLLAAVFGLAAGSAAAQDAQRGAELYMQLPAAASCVSCHGSDPAGNRNNILKAAQRPQALLKALNGVAAMGYLKSQLDETDIADLAAFLGSVLAVADPAARLKVWPLTADFGSLGFGQSGGPQQVRIGNVGPKPVALAAPALRGAAFSLMHDCPATLGAGASCTVSVSALAGTLGAVAGSLSLGSDALPAPVITALAAVVRPDSGGLLTWLRQEPVVDFAADEARIAGDAGPALRELVLANGGSAPVVLAGSTLVGPNAAQFSTRGCGAGTLLPPSGQCVLSLHYVAQAATSAEAVLQLRSNAANPPALVVRGGAAASAVDLPVQPEAPIDLAEVSAGSGAGGAALAWVAGLAIAVLRLARRRRASGR